MRLIKVALMLSSVIVILLCGFLHPFDFRVLVTAGRPTWILRFTIFRGQLFHLHPCNAFLGYSWAVSVLGAALA